MKNLFIGKQYSHVLLDFINNEIINSRQDMDGVIEYDNIMIEENNTDKNNNYLLNQCFLSLSKLFSIDEINEKISLWFPYGLLISAHQFNYETIKNYILYLSQKYYINEKDLFFNPEIFFDKSYRAEDNIMEEIQHCFKKYQHKYFCIKNLQQQLNNCEDVNININEDRLLKTNYIININDKNKDFLEFLLDNEIYNGNSIISYAGKDMYLLEYFLMRSLTCSQQIIKKLILQVNLKNLIEIKQKINQLDLSYLIDFKEEAENFKENMYIVDKKILYLKFAKEHDYCDSFTNDIVKI